MLFIARPQLDHAGRYTKCACCLKVTLLLGIEFADCDRGYSLPEAFVQGVQNSAL